MIKKMSMRFPWDKSQRQTNNIVMITFWSQFATYSLNTILILFLTRPLLQHGLGYSEAQAYAFVGISFALHYLMPILGGYIADNVIGIRRSILLGSAFLALTYSLIMLSGYSLAHYGDRFFIATYAFIPAVASLLMGTSSAMVSTIYAKDAIRAKSAMTYYYMAINVGALLATILSPMMLESTYGPLSIFAVAFLGKSLAALNFAKNYSLYDNVIIGKDTKPLTFQDKLKLLLYLAGTYAFTLFAYSHIVLASAIVSICALGGVVWFFIRTGQLMGDARKKQAIALILIVEAILFFVIYNQMNTTLILFAKYHSNLFLFGVPVSPAQYQMLNPILIILLGTQLPKFYKYFPKFIIPYQFAAGTLLAAIALLLMAYASAHATNGHINGNYIGITYILITLAELWVSAIGLSMIGLYCESKQIAFAMGVWYLASALSHLISGHIAGFVAVPTHSNTVNNILLFQHYYLKLGAVSLLLGILMLGIAHHLIKKLSKEGVVLA